MQNREAVIAEIEKYKPTHILNAAGSTGRPNVDWCEDHKPETIRNNVIGTINLADVAYEKGIHITVFATGCIYAYDEKHPIGGPGFLETDKANFDGSFYSETKAHVEEVCYTIPYLCKLSTNRKPDHEVLPQRPHPQTSHASQRRPPLP